MEQYETSECRSTARALTDFLVRNLFYKNVLTFLKENTDSKAEVDGTDSIHQQKQEYDGGVGLAYDRSLGSLDTEEQGHDGYSDEQVEKVFGEPSRPVKPVTQTHHLHGFLTNTDKLES